MDHSVLLRVLRFYLCFLVFVDLCGGFHRNSSLELPLLSVAGFSVYLLTSHTESCDEYVEEVGVDDGEEEQTRDYEWHMV